ncbi:unnamed protein product, partial [Linum tenue]
GRRLTVIDQRGRPVPSSATSGTTASTTIRGLSFGQGKGKRGSPPVRDLPAMDAAVRVRRVFSCMSYLGVLLAISIYLVIRSFRVW